jgi:fumarate reductase subunit C
MNVRLYILQRATAVVMAPLVLAHIVVIYYATSHGLSAAEILGRTRGSIAWGAFYGLFVLAAATHGAIGVRAVASEWTGLRGRRLDALMWSFGLVLAALGLRAVAAVVLP